MRMQSMDTQLALQKEMKSILNDAQYAQWKERIPRKPMAERSLVTKRKECTGAKGEILQRKEKETKNRKAGSTSRFFSLDFKLKNLKLRSSIFGVFIFTTVRSISTIIEKFTFSITYCY